MNKKNIFAFIGLSALAPVVVAVATIGASLKNKTFNTQATDGPYSITLTSANTPAGLTESFVDNFETTIKTTNGNDINIGMTLAKKVSGKFVNLGHRGMLYNFGSSSGRITGITSITTTFDNPLYIKTSSQELSSGNGSGVMLEDLKQLTSGSTYTLTSPAKYFVLIAGDANVSITNLTINYSCSNPGIGFDAIKGSYTGKSGRYTYQLDFSRENSTQKVVWKSLNKATNDLYNGTATISGNNVISTINGATYTSQIQQDGRLLKFVSVSPSGLPEIDFYKVYDVENFENYTTAGIGWDKTNNNSATTGARSHWFADYNDNGSSPIGGSSWSLMGSTDYLQFDSAKGHNGSKVVAFKGNGTNPCRFIQMNAYFGVPSIVGRGSTLSFWSSGAYSNAALTTKSSNNATIRVIAYYNTKIDSTNHTVYDYQDFTIPANSGWTEYTMDLDSSKNYYSVGFICNKGGTYTPIDDIRIYTYSPFVEYYPETYPEGTYKTTVTLGSISMDVVFAIGNYKNQLVRVLAANTDMEAQGIVYNESTQAITIETTGDYNGNTCGTITGTYDSTNDRITNINCDGSIKSYVKNKTATHPSYYYTCDGSTSELQTQFKRRYMSGSWQTDSSNADRITKDTEHFVSGSGAVKRRGYSGGAVALNLNSDISGGITVKNIGYWVYNPSNSDIELRQWVYKGTGLTSGAEIGAVTAAANSWTYCKMGFTQAKIYNFQIADFNNTGVYLTFDNIILF